MSINKILGVVFVIVFIVFSIQIAYYFRLTSLISNNPTSVKTTLTVPKDSLKEATSSSSSQSSLPNPNMCPSYLNILSGTHQKEFMANISEGLYAASDRGLVVGVEASITWAGKIARILEDEVYVTKTCQPNNPSSCRDYTFINTYLIELKHRENDKTDVPVIFNQKNIKKQHFFLVKKGGANYEEVSFNELAKSLKKDDVVSIRRMTRFSADIVYDYYINIYQE